ncbi:S41 family peptidase [Listeria grayi]|uniref:Peptidase, S41 family n=2 Tax=Listeria grayi TaxID=1641 RepID=D7UY61_LISGR|nr:S41 family peptidase [Listeria grayi]EFI84619.1 peptidase, S41 family [Listeria grayi DSM 20601]STY42828.1 Carboxy-terminal processing protease CtpB precursor [Listeria grayi]
MSEENPQDKDEKLGKGYIKIKLFPFIMLIFAFVFVTALVTTIVMSLGADKQVKVSIPERKEFTKLYSVYDEIAKKYYKEPSASKMIDGAIKGMVGSLDDPYSTFMSKKEASEFDDTISSSFEGIGAEIQEKDGNIVVVSPIKNSPAEKAGLKPQDVIVKVNGKALKGNTATEATQKIRGEKGSKVDLVIQRPGEEKSFNLTITRDKIPVETVYSTMGKDKIAHITISTFSENTYNELEKALKKQDDKGMKGLVLDLRGNPGGLLDQAVDISSLFIDNGKTVVQEQPRDGKKAVITADSAKHDNYKVTVPTTILIDGGSASASEILAAAAKESGNVKLVGTKSFGKGTVQTAEPLEDGSTIKLTIAKWLTPDGEWIHEKGIKPDYEVKMPAYATSAVPSPKNTYQLNDFGKEVKNIETYLKALGFNVGKVDGLYDLDTQYAVSRFQAENDLEQTGKVTGKTTTKLIEAIQKHLQKTDPQLKKAKELVK